MALQITEMQQRRRAAAQTNRLITSLDRLADAMERADLRAVGEALRGVRVSTDAPEVCEAKGALDPVGARFGT